MWASGWSNFVHLVPTSWVLAIVWCRIEPYPNCLSWSPSSAFVLHLITSTPWCVGDASPQPCTYRRGRSLRTRSTCNALRPRDTFCIRRIGRRCERRVGMAAYPLNYALREMVYSLLLHSQTPSFLLMVKFFMTFMTSLLWLYDFTSQTLLTGSLR